MADTEWTLKEDIITNYEIVTSPHRAGGEGGWGDAWGFFAWGSHDDYEDFTKVEMGALTEWTKL